LVTAETRARVQEAASELSYSPHGAARSLITSRTHTIGVLLPDLYGEFFSELIRGIDFAAHHAGFHLLVSSARHQGPPLEAGLRSMRGRVDGLLLMCPEFTREMSGRTLPGRYPVVLLNCPPSAADCDSLSVDNYVGAFPMARYLTPALTSVHVDIGALGARAAARLFEALRSPAECVPASEILPTTLVIRQSCGARTTTPRRDPV